MSAFALFAMFDKKQNAFIGHGIAAVIPVQPVLFLVS